MSDEPLEFTVRTELDDRPISGFDSLIMAVPEQIQAPGQLVVSTRLLMLAARLSMKSATTLGEQLHHADWQITNDPAVIEARGLTHDCDRCRAETDKALLALRENPDTMMFVGMLYWADMR